MVRVSYYEYDNISSSLIHVIYIRRGYDVKGLHFDCKSNNTLGSIPTYLYILTNSMVE